MTETLANIQPTKSLRLDTEETRRKRNWSESSVHSTVKDPTKVRIQDFQTQNVIV